jgi:hypothetical protein
MRGVRVGARNKENNFGLTLNYVCLGDLSRATIRSNILYWLRYTVTKLVLLLEVCGDKMYGDINVNWLSWNEIFRQI